MNDGSEDNSTRKGAVQDILIAAQHLQVEFTFASELNLVYSGANRGFEKGGSEVFVNATIPEGPSLRRDRVQYP